MPLSCPLYHRGFGLTIHAHDARAGFAFRVTQHGQALHTSPATYRTAVSAERAARLFVDDALCAYDWATRRLAAGAYSSSK